MDIVRIERGFIDAASRDQNNGGCGFFAREAYNLFLNLGEDAAIIVCSDQDEDGYLKDLQYSMDNDDINDLVPNHVAVVVREILFDATGAALDGSSFWFERSKIEITLEQLEHLLTLSEWCNLYDLSYNDTLRNNFIKLRDELLSEMAA